MSQPVVLNDVTFPFSDSKHEMFAYVSQHMGKGPGKETDFKHLYTTVVLYVSGLKGQQVFSGSAIAVPDDWNNTAKSIKMGVQLALKRGIGNYLEHTLPTVHYCDLCYHQISSAFWKEFLKVTKLGEQ